MRTPCHRGGMKTPVPATLLEAITFFADEANAHAAFVEMRWPEGVICPHCGSARVGDLSESVVTSKRTGKQSVRRIWNCKDCKAQFTAKVGTIFEDSPLPLSKWLPAVWMICNAKNGISSYELHRALGVTQKSAWFMLHRIRESMRSAPVAKLSGDVEVDETYIGGRARFMHKSRNEKRGHGTGYVGKQIVMGLLERDGKVVVKHLPKNRRKELHGEIVANVAKGSTVHTDALMSYEKMPSDFVHQAIDHAVAYVQGNVHTNGMENFWCLLKRTLKGTYVSVAPYHLHRYLDEQTTRFNERKDENGDGGRFGSTMSRVNGRRLTYKKLTGKQEGER
jgi:transposase-like protein